MKGIASGRGVRVEAGSESLISSAGGSMLLKTAAASGLAAALSQVLVSWRAPRSVHDPGKTVLDLAVAIALGGDCLADAAVVRAQSELFGTVASDPTISRLIEALGADSAAAIAAIREARAAARATVWSHRWPIRRRARWWLIWTLPSSAHTQKRRARPRTSSGASGFTRYWPSSTTAPAAPVSRWWRCCAQAKLPPTTRPMIAVLDAALTQLPEQVRSRVLVRGDTGSGVHGFVWHIHNRGLQYSVGIYARQPVLDALAALPARHGAQHSMATVTPARGLRSPS